MLILFFRAFVITFGLIGSAMAQERILISSEWGKVTAELVDNNATRTLVQMLPISIEMRDHLRQERPAICLRPCRQSSGSSISRPVHWDYGVPITLSFTIATDASLNPGLSHSAE